MSYPRTFYYNSCPGNLENLNGYNIININPNCNGVTQQPSSISSGTGSTGPTGAQGPAGRDGTASSTGATGPAGPALSNTYTSILNNFIDTVLTQTILIELRYKYVGNSAVGAIQYLNNYTMLLDSSTQVIGNKSSNITLSVSGTTPGLESININFLNINTNSTSNVKNLLNPIGGTTLSISRTTTDNIISTNTTNLLYDAMYPLVGVKFTKNYYSNSSQISVNASYSNTSGIYLGGNISSAIVQLNQGDIITLGYLYLTFDSSVLNNAY